MKICKKIVRNILFFLLFLPTVAFSENIKLPYKNFYLKEIYKLENGKTIYIEQFERGDRIWEVNEETNEFNKITSVWNFVAMGKQCEHIKSKNFYFAQNLEYWFAGGTNIDYAQIRIFDLYDSSPWRDSDLGITPNMEYAKEWCTFYEPIYVKE